MNSQANYDALIAAAMHAKARRSNGDTHADIAILEAVQSLYSIDDLVVTIADMRHDLELVHGKAFEGRNQAQERSDYVRSAA